MAGTDRTPLGTGSIGDTVTLDNGGLAWFGMATDPFWADGPALLRFLTGARGR